MVVGVCRITLSLRGNDSLKGKRRVIRPILDRVRARYNVAAAEVADNDVHQRAVLGFAVVSNDGRHATSMIDDLVSFVAGSTEALVIDRYHEIIHVGDEL